MFCFISINALGACPRTATAPGLGHTWGTGTERAPGSNGIVQCLCKSIHWRAALDGVQVSVGIARAREAGIVALEGMERHGGRVSTPTPPWKPDRAPGVLMGP